MMTLAVHYCYLVMMTLAVHYCYLVTMTLDVHYSYLVTTTLAVYYCYLVNISCTLVLPGNNETSCTLLIAPNALTCSIPQRSVIGPKEFVMLTEDIKETIDRFIINLHLYADDFQLLAHMKIIAITEHRQHALKASGTGVPHGGCS